MEISNTEIRERIREGIELCEKTLSINLTLTNLDNRNRRCSAIIKQLDKLRKYIDAELT